jgi:acyl-CoA dehydrogenase
MWAQIRTLRLADGPDEVHLQQMGRNENKRGQEVTANILKQADTTKQMLAKYNVSLRHIGPKSKL